jgi:hypothetical protein
VDARRDVLRVEADLSEGRRVSGSVPSVEVPGNVLAGRYRLVRPVAQGGLASV